MENCWNFIFIFTNLLKAVSYDEFWDYLPWDKYKNNSSRDLKEMIDKYKKSELDLIRFWGAKKKKIKKARK